MIENIIFDWSGTLVDDLPAVWQASNYVFRRAGVAELTLEQFRAEFCLPFKGFYDRFVPHVPLPELEVWFHGHFREVQDVVCELPYAREFLEFCRCQALRCFILSTVHPDHFARQALQTGFATYFEQVYVGVADKRLKIVELLTEHQLVPNATLFVGDMEHDMETAHHGGVHSCAVLTGYNGLAQLRRSRPELIVEHLGQLQQFLIERQLEWSMTTGPAPTTP